MRLLSWMAALALVAACASKPVEEKSVPITPDRAAPRAAAPAPAKPLIGDCGLDLSAGNHNVKPGDDFFAYANGAWYEGFTIPADHASFGPFDKLDELSKQRVRAIIEEAAATHAAGGTPEQQIGDFYAAFMDEAAIEANGLAPVQADLQRIAAANTRQALAHLFGEPGFASLFDVQLPADFKNPDRYSVFDQPIDARPSRPRLLPQGRSAAQGAARQVRCLHRADAHPRRRERRCGRGARHHGVRDRGGEGAVADREAPRCGGH